jgi:ABC-type amino acid transport substrate-binding protein
MKKLAIAIVFVFVITLLAGCGSKDDGSYSDLMIMSGVELAVEEYAIGFRVGSDVVPEVNKLIKELNDDGTLAAIAEKYDLSASLMSNDAMSASFVDMGRMEAGDLANIKGKGVLKIGITIYEPMNYYDKDGNLTGFDTEFAEAVCEKLGVKPEFIEINWDTKEIELAATNIDCIWNGLTVTEERRQNIEFSVPYIKNMQVVVIRKADSGKFKTIDDLAGAKLTAEISSAGESAIQNDPVLSGAAYTSMAKQTDALMEVKAGTSDAAVLDWTLAKALVGV